jgi:hypothetical protein
MCSFAARGLWIDLMSYMHEGTPYGHFLIDGKQPNMLGISALMGRPLGEVKKAIAELESHGVFSRSDNGTIYSRRMVRDKAKAEQDRDNGKGGGNPDLLIVDKRGVNPPVNGEDKTPDKAQWPLVVSSASLSVSATTLGSKEVEEEQACGREFDEFYALYPHKIGPKDARKSFIKARKTVDFTTLITGLLRYTAKTDDRPWCNPATWLNQGRWADEPAKNTGAFNGPSAKVSPITANIDRRIEQFRNASSRDGEAPVGLLPDGRRE